MAALHTNNQSENKPGEEESWEAQVGAAGVRWARDGGHVRDRGHARPGHREAGAHTADRPEYEDADVLT